MLNQPSGCVCVKNVFLGSRFSGSCALLLLFAALATTTLPAYGQVIENESIVAVYIYEQFDSRHVTGSTVAAALSSNLTGTSYRPVIAEPVPLVSNETIRLLQTLESGEKIHYDTTVRAFFRSGVISFTDRSISDRILKYQDLTWHVDTDACVKDAQERGASYLLIGDIQGRTRPAPVSGSALTTGTVTGRLRLIRASDSAAIWSNFLTQSRAAFDGLSAMEEAAADLGAVAAKQIVDAQARNGEQKR